LRHEWRKQEKVFRLKEKKGHEKDRLQADVLEELDARIPRLQSEVSSLNSEIEELRKEVEFKQHEIEDLTQSHNHKITKEHERSQMFQSELENEREIRAKFEHSNSDLKHALDQFGRQSEEQDRQIQELHGALEQLRCRFKEKLKEERANNDTKLTGALRQMSEKTTEYLATIQSLNDQITQLQEKICQLEALNSELTLRLQKQDTRISALTSEHTRERKSRESQMKAMLLAAESEFQGRLEQSDTGLKQLFGLLNETMQQFLPNAVFSEENIDQLLREIVRDFANLLEQDRKLREMLQVLPQNSLLDAVAHLQSHRAKGQVTSRL
jgi:chromosome segregation ATPase